MLLSDSAVSATLEDKLRWAFRIYDKDTSGVFDMSWSSSFSDMSSGFISVAEMVTVLGTVYGLEGVDQVSHTLAEIIE